MLTVVLTTPKGTKVVGIANLNVHNNLNEKIIGIYLVLFKKKMNYNRWKGVQIKMLKLIISLAQNI
jgi:hypothetical protein